MTHTIRVVLVVSATALLTACSAAPTAGTSNQPIPASASKPEQEAGSQLADLAQRDVDAFLNRRKESAQPPEQEIDRAEPPKIIWNDDRPASTAATPSTENTADFAQSPLFLVADEQPTVEQQPSPSAQSPTALDQDRVRALVVELSKELYQEAAHADMPLRELFLIAATSLVSPDRALNADAIPGLTARERDILREFQAFFVELGGSLDGSSDAEQAILSSLEQLRASLSTEPQLTLGTVALCTRVGGFGDFDPFNRYAFLAHSQQQAVVYIEIAGFTSELNQKDEWVTELSQQLVIYSERDGIPVWREDWQTAVDRSRNKRTDFFVVQLVTLPQALSVGRYHMKVRVRDERSKAEAESTIEFEMVADPKMAARVQ